MSNYDDIINLPHHVSSTREPMTLYNRASQFAPFSALTGYDEEIKETARLTDRKIELDEDTKNILNQKIIFLFNQINLKPKVNITYFVPDNKKNGGIYKSVFGNVKKIDNVNKIIYFYNLEKINIDDILSLEIIDD